MAAPLHEVKEITEAEVIFVDDGSTDGTLDLLAQLERTPAFAFTHHLPATLRVIRNTQNEGKGASVRTGIRSSTGDIVIIQDADLEYFPSDYPALLRPIISNEADAVFGSRFIGYSSRHAGSAAHAFSNWLATRICNVLNNISLTDMETCYKVMRGHLARNLKIVSNRFGVEPEIASRLAHAHVRIHEVPVRYLPREYHQGKKLNVFKDGVAVGFHILRFALWDREPFITGGLQRLFRLEHTKLRQVRKLAQQLITKVAPESHPLKVLLVGSETLALIKELLPYGQVTAVVQDGELFETLRQHYGFSEGFVVQTDLTRVSPVFDIIVTKSEISHKPFQSWLNPKGILAELHLLRRPTLALISN